MTTANDTVDLTGPRWDLPIRRGVSLLFDYVQKYTDSDGVHLAGDPVNLTGCTFAGQIRRTKSSSAIIASLTFTVTDAAAGEVTVSLDKSLTSLLTASRYVWDATYTDADGIRLALWQGELIVEPWVTQ